MMNQSARLLIALAWTIALNADAQSVTGVYENPRMAGRMYAKILIVGAHADVDRRRRFENDVVTSFEAQGVGAVSALTTLAGDQTINRDVLATAARDTGSDAVLITRLVEVRTSQTPPNGRATDAGRRDDQPLADFFRDDYASYRDPMAVTTATTVLVASDLYDVASEKRVWSGESTAFAKNDVDEAIAAIAKGVTRVLRAGGWLD
jgi:hypothetical protein